MDFSIVITVNLKNEGLNTPLHYLAKNFATLSEPILHDLIAVRT